MSFNGSGTFSLAAGNPVVSGTTIQSTWANNTLSDIASGLSLCLVRDGQSAMTGDLPMGGKSIVNGLNATFSGVTTSGNVVVTSTTIPANGIYLPATNTLGLASASTLRLSINATGNFVMVVPSAGIPLTLDLGALGAGANPGILIKASAAALASLICAGNGQTAGTGSLDLIQDGAGSGFLYNRGNFPLAFGTNNAARINIAASGAVTVNAPASGNSLTVSQLTTNNAIVLAASAGNPPVIQWTINAAVQGYFGFSGAAAQICSGSVAGDLVLRAEAGGLLFSPVGGNTRFKIDGTTSQGTLYEPLNAINAMKNIATYETGSFTATYVGGTTSPTGTANWTRVGNTIILELPVISATSNSTSFSYSGLPAAISPARGQAMQAAWSGLDNTVVVAGVGWSINAAGTSVLFHRAGSTTGWTAAGSKAVGSGTAAIVCVYNLN
jgi:hypothetical protein